MFKIIGADQKEYGPVSADQLRRWIGEGRVNGQTPVQAEGSSEWKPLSSYAEFAEGVLLAPPAPSAGPGQTMMPGLPPDIYERDYDLDIGQCISDGYNLLKGNFGNIFGAVAVSLIIQGFCSALGQIPKIGPFFSLATSILVVPPLTAGVFYFLLKNIRRQPNDLGEIFSGFRLAFGQLIVGYLVSTLLTLAAALPGIILIVVGVMSGFNHHGVHSFEVMMVGLGALLALPPVIYLSISWLFTLPLIIDRQMEFWPAMNASRRMVGKHWWMVFGLVVVCGLVNVVGILMCCVGVFLSAPIVFAALMYGYESIFSAPNSQQITA